MPCCGFPIPELQDIGHFLSCCGLTNHQIQPAGLPQAIVSNTVGLQILNNPTPRVTRRTYPKPAGNPRYPRVTRQPQPRAGLYPRSRRFGSEPPSVENDVDVWRYTILELHARNDDDLRHSDDGLLSCPVKVHSSAALSLTVNYANLCLLY